MSDSAGDSGDPRLFPALAGLVLSGQTMSGLLDLIVDLAVSVLDGIDQASVSVVHRDGKQFETSNSTSVDIREIDEAQYAEAEGPCVQAIRTGAEVAIELPVGQWPVFSQRATRGGIRSVTSLPLTAAGRTGGALNLYSTTTTALTDHALTTARALAAQGAVVLANASALAMAEMTNQQLQEALETRDLIGQAKGILMGRQRVNSDTAFDMLRRASQRTNRKLRDVAADIIEHFGDPEADR